MKNRNHQQSNGSLLSNDLGVKSLQGSQNDYMTTTSQGTKKKQPKDFKKAYKELVAKMYNDQGQRVTGLLTDEEIIELEKYNNLNEKEFLERVNQFHQNKQEKIAMKQNEAMSKNDEECSFAPNLYTTADGGAQNIKNSKPRDFQKFLSDQERYSEYKSLNSQKIQ